MKKIPTVLALSICSSVGWASLKEAQAVTATGNLEVRITITSQCLVNAGTGGTGAGNSVLDFASTGVLNANTDGASSSTGVGSIQVQCNNGTPYTVGLDAGMNAGTPSDVNTRRMKLNAAYVAYQLYQDANRTAVWGNTQPAAGGAGGNVVSRTADGTVQSFRVYGRVPPQTTPGVGTYTDTVAITVTY